MTSSAAWSRGPTRGLTCLDDIVGRRRWWRMWTEARIDRFYTVSPNGYGADAERFFLGSYWRPSSKWRKLKNDYGFSDPRVHRDSGEPAAL